jgi:haloacetate dehalogenase
LRSHAVRRSAGGETDSADAIGTMLTQSPVRSRTWAPPTLDPTAFFPGFEPRDVDTARGPIHVLVGGSGPPLLLLHGYPESHLMWHGAAPLLAEEHTVVAADLAGYGASFVRPPRPTTRRTASGRWPPTRSRRWRRSASSASRSRATTAAVAWRTGWRWTVPSAWSASPSSTSSPRRGVGGGRRRLRPRLLALVVPLPPAPLPERLIGGDPQAYFDLHVRAGLGLGAAPGRYPAEVLAAYRRALDDPAAVEAMCEDYRAGASVDAERDDADAAAGRRIACPVLVLWGRPRCAAALLRRRLASGGRGRRTCAARRSTARTSSRGPPGGDRRGAAGLPPRRVTRRPGNGKPRDRANRRRRATVIHFAAPVP